MEVLVLLVCLSFQLLFMFLTFVFRDRQVIGVLGVVFGLYIVADLAYNGLTETIGYVGGSELVHTYDVSAILLIPAFVLILTAVCVIQRLR